jgi:phosphatidylglycerophosphate synthase
VRLLWLPEDEWVRIRKCADSLFTVVCINPLVRFLFPLVVRSRVTPNRVTLLRFGVAAASAVSFLALRPVTGAVLFVLWYVMDCIDGKLARFTGSASMFGDWFDRATDRVGVGLIVVAEGLFFKADGAPNGLELCLAFLCVWYLTITNSLVLEVYRSSLGVGNGTQPGGVGASLFCRWRQWTRKNGVIDMLVDDPEWLMLAIVVAPVCGCRTLIAIAAVFMAGQKAVETAGFWVRRLPRSGWWRR